MNLWHTYLALPTPVGQGHFCVEPGTGRFRVARSSENNPTVLVELDQSSTSSVPRRLANLSYSPPALVEIADVAGFVRHARFAVIECRTTDAEIGQYFFRMVYAVLVENPSAKDESGFESALDALVALFRSLHLSASRTAQGLWAELAIIYWASVPTKALAAWHSKPTALHDFVIGASRVEVKSTIGRLREHIFRLEQLTSHQSSTVIASLMLVEADSGVSVYDLVEMIGDKIGAEARARLSTIVGESLGQAWRDAADLRFDLEAAYRKLRLYRAADVPSVSSLLPPAVKDVSFTSDLSSLDGISDPELSALGRDILDLLPLSKSSTEDLCR